TSKASYWACCPSLPRIPTRCLYSGKTTPRWPRPPKSTTKPAPGAARTTPSTKAASTRRSGFGPKSCTSCARMRPWLKLPTPGWSTATG
nr:hypothetical protein [Tanacetum cinerariifolium]